MLKIKYLLLAITILGLSACSSPKIITINENSVIGSPSRTTVTAPIKRSDIKEEILLGEGSKNSSLGNRMDISRNNPTLGEMIDTYGDGNISDTIITPNNEVIERISFPVEEYKYVKKRGRSTVSGKIYLENSNTSLKISGEKIKLWLNPVTSYSRQWYEESYLGGYKLSKTDKRLYNYLKFTYSDRSGSFNFFGVPAGDYYLTGTISCSEECGFNQNKSIRLVREISVGRGVTTVDLMKHVP